MLFQRARRRSTSFGNIGTAKTDDYGAFSLMWAADIPGMYTVIATFEGSDSYYRSYAETSFGVEQAPEPTVGPTSLPASQAETYITGFGIATIAAIVAVGAAILVMLRKR